MTSYLIDKLEALKEDENKLKEQQRVLQEEIELEIEKKRRLELDGTIIKLRTQVGELAKNIEGKIMPDNRLVLQCEKYFIQKNGHYLILQEARQALRDFQPQLLTLEKFKDNLSKVKKKKKELVNSCGGSEIYELKKQVNGFIPHQIKIYDDIIPIFTTMIGIMKKQEFEIDALKSKLDM
ncbi:MAG: hypothetical protein ACTSPA_13060 [Promethearchaeota archaeon]